MAAWLSLYALRPGPPYCTHFVDYTLHCTGYHNTLLLNAWCVCNGRSLYIKAMCTNLNVYTGVHRYKLDRTVNQHDLFANIFLYESSLLQGQDCATINVKNTIYSSCVKWCYLILCFLDYWVNVLATQKNIIICIL